MPLRPAPIHPLLACRAVAAAWRGPLVGLAWLLAAGVVAAQGVDAKLSDELQARITELASHSAAPGGQASASAATAVRIEVEVGQLDPRLQLAPCQRIEPYLPAGLPAWGRTRIGLKCVQGPKAWNVSLPITVKVWRQALVLRDALPAGTVLTAQHLMDAEVDMAAAPGAALTDPALAVGRSLVRPLAAGSALRQPDMKSRLWFAAGETVKVIAGGPGWKIASEGQAMNAGLEGQIIRVRMDNGKLLQGRAVADRLVEISL
ncbi:flagellar basal body P-ring formation chaperone FlgA [Ideonella sp.]|uniref:flagellar basal body P-ring formation chaperone FlgA n=1 Tax=Ideonella sp. TaxID=1929293 RepID=UPI003BB755BB